MVEKRVDGSREVSYEADVVVVGGGPAGVAAAFSAARQGASVLLVEQFNCLGGVATAGGHGHICLFSSWASRERIVGGVPFEIVSRVARAGYGVCGNHDADFEIEGMKLVLEQMAGECGVRLLYHAFFCGAVVEDGAVAGVYVQSKSGRRFVKAARVIDCTGDGDVGTAAALSLRGGCRPRNVDIRALQAALRAQQCIVDEGDIADAREPAAAAGR